jgi:mannose-6-phosphate isomerase-like protein (cupin superfamily)
MAVHETPPGIDPADPAYVENPVTGERARFHTPPDDPESDPLEFDVWAVPEMVPLAEHVHPRQDETFTVGSGTLELVREGEPTTHTAGETVTVPAGTPHTWRNPETTELHLTVRLEPGLRTEAFLRDLAALGERGELRADGSPSLLQVAALYDAYGYDLLHLASPPLRVQKLVFGALTPVARTLGYRADPVAPERE